MAIPNYNMTKLSTTLNVADLAKYADDVSNNILFGLITTGLFFVLLLILKKWDFVKALLASSFAMFIVTAILSYGGFLNFMYPLIYLIILAFTGLYAFMHPSY